MKFIPFLSLLILTACTTDRPLIYQEGYVRGESDKLRFDGFYNDPTVDLDHPSYNPEYKRAVFFFSDGSVFFMALSLDTASIRERLEQDKDAYGEWGNYNVFNDTIRIETFDFYGGSNNLKRNTLVGLVQNEQIHFIHKTNPKGRTIPLDYIMPFSPFSIKPDSTFNWIRTAPKYNK